MTAPASEPDHREVVHGQPLEDHVRQQVERDAADQGAQQDALERVRQRVVCGI